MSRRVRVRLGVLLALAALLVAAAVFAPALCPFDPYVQDYTAALQAPGAVHWFGTDRYGRDLFSRVVMGARSSLSATLLLVGLSAAAGTAAGVAGGMLGGWADALALRLADLCLAFPGTVFALALAAVLGGGLPNAVLALALINWPKYARLARARTRLLLQSDWAAAQKLAGTRPLALLARHLLPNLAGQLLVTAAMDTGTMMMELAGLSFLGLGAQPPVAEWGSMMSDGRSLLALCPWVVLAPGLAIFLTVVVFNLLGDAVHDALTPGAEPPARGAAVWQLAAVALAAAGLVLLVGGPAPQNASAAPVGGKTFVLGDTTFSPEHEESSINPHEGYSGWACIRYGVGETLLRYSDEMALAPWLAESWQRLDDCTWQFVLREGVTFSSGRALDAAAAKQCLEHLIAVNDRAAGELNIAAIEADGRTLTITTAAPNPALPNYLSDPYACLIDMDAGVTAQGIVCGTGPYRAVELVTGERLELEPNAAYWNGMPKLDHITVRTITDGDTLTMALQTGEIDAAYGLPYASYPLFENENYTISSTPTSRAFLAAMNFESPVTSDAAVRRAIALGLDKDTFVSVLLGGHGYPADGPYPANFALGAGITAPDYDPDAARALLDGAGWVDTDGDGIREKDGRRLTIRWLTYPSRQELPLLAESAQATLRDIGIEVEIQCTAGHNTLRTDPTAWDVYASALVTAPTGDPAYFFVNCCLDGAPANNGRYHSDALETLAGVLGGTFDTARRTELAAEMQRILLQDDAFVFCSHLQMSLVARAGVTGLTAHPCDYYEITAALDKA